MILHVRYFTRTRLVYLISIAFLIVGITGLLWNRHFGHSTQITINDNSSEAVECIQQNCDLNGVLWRKGASNYDSPGLNGTSSEGVEITHSDANVLMHQRQFHFM
jgi:tRNA G26 N,N-dimethylase Trm1